ncbi:hypothetical protein JHD48_07430 [Sulfurimonas sp. SAG-AH-194-I05]|nr:hypothetical protein [Sulfurimonas sp. SAG-AH-194-I05]MDF1875562.1 hypothetical protein [Sulfurimonas sp. SAG-AH-194-I05]
MRGDPKHITSLVEYVKIDRFYISCHFKCDIKNKTVVSTVAFEPYNGKIEFTWAEIIFHPIRSYNKYYHTPITIYGDDVHDTIVLKAFKRVSNYFVWNQQQERYIYN